MPIVGSSISSLSASAPLSEPVWTAEARAGLAALEPRFAAIEGRAGPIPLAPPPARLRRAAALHLRPDDQQRRRRGDLEAPVGPGRARWKPASFLELDDAALCGVAGLSRPKAAHARSLARACLDGSLDFAAIAALDDAGAVARIAAVKGLGPWTASIYLLFAEDRVDIFPATWRWLPAPSTCWTCLRARPARPGGASPRLVPLARMAARLLWHHWCWATGRAAGEA